MDVIQVTRETSGLFAGKIAAIHSAAYSHGHFTSSFPADKLTEYNGLLIDNSDVTLVAIEDGQAVGFIIAGRHVSSGVREFTRRNRIFLIRRLLSRPDFLFEKLLWKVRSLASPATPSIADFRLLSIAIAPNTQSRGVGARLLEAFEEQLMTIGVPRYGLSVISKNVRAIDFYRRNGFREEKTTWDGVYFYKDVI